MAPHEGSQKPTDCSLSNREEAGRHISSQIEVLSEGKGMVKTGLRERSSTERDTLPRKVCLRSPFP